MLYEMQIPWQHVVQQAFLLQEHRIMERPAMSGEVDDPLYRAADMRGHRREAFKWFSLAF